MQWDGAQWHCAPPPLNEQAAARLTSAETQLAALESSSGFVPVGGIVPFGGLTAPPGWAICDGAALPRATFASLFTVIGTTYGNGDGSTTFNVPDLRGRVAVGVDAATGRVSANNFLGAAAGAESHVLSVAEMPAHGHGVNDPGHFHTVGNTINYDILPSFQGGGQGVGASTIQTSREQAGISIVSTGGTQPHGNMPPYQVTQYIIRAN